MNLTINNYSAKNRQSFYGTFKKTPEMDIAIKKATDYDLRKFSLALKRMSAEKDDRFFKLNSSVDYNAGREEFTKNINLHEYSKYETIHNVGKEVKSEPKNFVGNCYNNVIKRITQVLEDIYPEKEHMSIPREKSLNEISQYLE